MSKELKRVSHNGHRFPELLKVLILWVGSIGVNSLLIFAWNVVVILRILTVVVVIGIIFAWEPFIRFLFIIELFKGLFATEVIGEVFRIVLCQVGLVGR